MAERTGIQRCKVEIQACIRCVHFVHTEKVTLAGPTFREQKEARIPAKGPLERGDRSFR
jgi:hypothetical protein